MTDLYDFSVITIDGDDKTLRAHAGNVLLIVNTASQCGLTPQYAGLEKLHADYGERGFEVLGFPCNQFGKQEPGDEAQIATFCESSFGVTFPMHAKIDVNGKGAHPLYEHLKSEQRGVLGTKAIKWNFTKFLVDREGRVVQRFAPKTPPEEIAGAIEKLL